MKKILPKKPRGDLRTLLDVSKKTSETLLGEALHNYLVQNLVEQDVVTCPLVSDVKPTKFEDTVDFLKRGYKMVKRQNCVTLCTSIDYGEWLNVAFELHYRDKLAGRISVSWKEFIDTEIGIKESYARKLREIASLLGKFSRFKKLGLSFFEIYQRRKEIANMLMLDCRLAEYWK